MRKLHLAQVNIARMLAPLEDPVMADFVARLDEINALADGSPGFVWRLQTDAGNATYLRPYDDDRIIINMSVWETVEDLRNYVYQSRHSEVLRRRREWFEKLETPVVALWWVPAGHVPSVDEAKKRSPTSKRTVPRHSPSRFGRSSRPTRSSLERRTGRPSSPARPSEPL